MFNWEVVGHKNALKFLENSITNEKLANAYLFYGPKNIGKSLIVQKFAKAIFCVDNENKPCEKCQNCNQINKGIYPDIYKIKKLPDKKDIIIEQARELRNNLMQGAFLNSYKVGIIEDVEYLNTQSWNSLLKILEEPQGKTIIILIANQIDKIPATIISRCQQIKLSLVSEDQIYNFLTAKNLGRDISNEIAKFVSGKIGLAKKIVDDPNWINQRNEELKIYLKLLDSKESIKNKNEIIEKTVKNGNKTNEAMSALSLLIRDLIFLKIAPTLIINLSFKNDLMAITENLSLEKLINLLDASLTFKNYLSYNANPRLVLENFVLEI
ncbi:ATP-binding protein [Patescibacteria group bacterium]